MSTDAINKVLEDCLVGKCVWHVRLFMYVYVLRFIKTGYISKPAESDLDSKTGQSRTDQDMTESYKYPNSPAV